MNSKYQTDDLRIADIEPVLNPATLLSERPITDQAARTIVESRNAVSRALKGMDDRLVVVSGPCSIHDVDAALEYASKLAVERERLQDDLLLIMRVYFEKPRTSVGWKGLINDPDLNESFNINKGLHVARDLLLQINTMGVPAGVEYLDIITPQYIADLVSWGAIGARTTESQVHREMASGLSCPVGFKNGTNGNVKIAVDAMQSSSHSHHFLTLTKTGQTAIFHTSGNDDCHIILRGGKQPNFDAESVEEASQLLQKPGANGRIMIDFSHANSGKIPAKQIDVAANVAAQLAGGEGRIFGVMIESHLVGGRQDVVDGQKLTYGQSITDACLDWERSKDVFDTLAEGVRQRRALSNRAAS